jgi:hypothetical protein
VPAAEEEAGAIMEEGDAEVGAGAPSEEDPVARVAYSAEAARPIGGTT